MEHLELTKEPIQIFYYYLMRHRPPFFGGEVGGTGKDEESEREN
jgi:hypothetical protein